MKPKILLIEDDRIISKFIILALKTHDYDIVSCETGLEGVSLFLSHHPDVVLLDLGLPDLDGMDILKQLRQIDQTPIIVVSARGHDQDKVRALDEGANDYVTKPFSISELLARIRVALRLRSNHDEQPLFEYRHLKVDFEKYRVLVHDEQVHLTPMEYKILELLIRNQGKVLTHSYIQKTIWGYDAVDDYKSLRVFVNAIRKKIDSPSQPPLLLTEVGVGYRFRDE